VLDEGRAESAAMACSADAPSALCAETIRAASATARFGARQPQRLPRAEVFQQEEGRQHAARNGAQRVRTVEQRQPAAVGIFGQQRRLRRRRQCAAHQDRGDAEHRQREQQAYHCRAEAAEAGLPAQRQIQRAHAHDQQRRQRRVKRDEQFEFGVKCERPRMAIGAAADQQSPDAQSAHEDRQHRRRGRRRGAEDQPELAQPRDLVDQRAEA
jgi:hypothetical protein